ncbi:MAG: hypothetical protein IRY95_10840, partial [Clostridia bacterium]|nr:hypothetical protein [Clostridia bacterium]
MRGGAAVADAAAAAAALATADAAWRAACEARDAVRGRLEAAAAERRQAEAALARLRSRLEAMEASAEGLSDGARAALAWRRAGDATFAAVVGTVADLIEVPADLEVAIAAAAGGALFWLVTRTGDEAQACIELLRARGAGRATFLPLDGLRPARPQAADRGLASLPGCLGWAVDLVRFDPVYGPAVMAVLGRTLVATDLGAARAVARAGGFRYRVVTREGDVVHAGGALSGGLRRGPGDGLARRRAREELRRAVAEAAAAAAAARREADALAAEVERRRQEVAARATARAAAEAALAERRQRLAAARAEEAALREGLRRLESQWLNLEAAVTAAAGPQAEPPA